MLNFSNSESLLKRALEIIPNGTQTFSKSRMQYPIGMAPLYIQRGKGSRVWDVDENEYIDFVSGLGSIILGYCDPDVDNAVQEQMKEGSIFSLPHPIEIEVSEMLINMIPCAEMVRFGKNGSDVTSGAVRLARYVTGRDHVLVCEGHYHGWQDWFNGSTQRNGGVPEAVKALTHTFKYNNIDSVYHAFHQPAYGYDFDDFACLIMEPMTFEWPKEGFLEEVKDMCHKNGVLFIFDEMLTGFRYPFGSAQKWFNVIPDLACFGKAMGNGYPISALVGKADIMRKMQDIHFSFTFGGDCIGLAAAKATIKKLSLKLIQKISRHLYSQLSLYLDGHPFRPKLNFKYITDDPDARNKIFQFCYENRILILDYINLNMSHSLDDIDKLARVIKAGARKIGEIKLKGERIDSQFRVRA